MKKIMIALLVVASIFVLASCTAAPVTTSLTLISKDCVADSGTALAVMADGAKAYTKDSSGAYTAITSKTMTYGTLVVTEEAVAGSSQDSWKFTYTGVLGKDGSETALTVYIGVLNSDGKSFKTQCATVTVNAKAVWTGTKEISVALSTSKTTASETLVSAGESIYVDDKAYTAAVDVKSAAGVKIGTLAAELSSDKKTVKFTFTDSLDKYADSVSGVAQTVVVKNGTTTVGTYKVTCSHVGTTPSYESVELVAETQSAKEVKSDYNLDTDKETLVVWFGKTETQLSKLGYISTDPEECDELVIDVENEDIINDWSVGKIEILPIGRGGKALSGVRFVLDTDYKESEYTTENNNGALGGASAEYYIFLKDSDGSEVSTYRLSATITPASRGINSVVPELNIGDFRLPTGLTDVYCYDEVEKSWDPVTDEDFVPLYDATTDKYVGYLSFEGDELNFSTDKYDKMEASYGKGSVKIGLNKDASSKSDLFEGVFYLSYENVEVSDTVSTVIKVKAVEGSKCYLDEIEASKTDVLYCRYIDSYSKGYVWSNWFEYGTAVEGAQDGEEIEFRYSKSLKSAGTLANVVRLKSGSFKCLFAANEDDTSTYGETGYYELAVVDEKGNVLSTYWVEGTNGYTED